MGGAAVAAGGGHASYLHPAIRGCRIEQKKRIMDTCIMHPGSASNYIFPRKESQKEEEVKVFSSFQRNNYFQEKTPRKKMR